MLEKFHNYQKKAEIYYIYHSIQRYTVGFLIKVFAPVIFKPMEFWYLYLTQSYFNSIRPQRQVLKRENIIFKNSFQVKVLSLVGLQ